MSLLDEPKQDGQMCPKCSKGLLQKKSGKYGAFLGCTQYPACGYTANMGVNLQRLASDLLKAKGKKKKTRRGKKKKPAWVLKRQKEKAEALRQYKKSAQERWENYQEFQRKIAD